MRPGRYILALFAVLGALESGAQPMVFENTQINGISISEDDVPAEFVFNFTNRGDGPLVITRVETSCGCAVAYYSKRPLRAGGKGEIKVTYNPEGNAGRLARTVLVYTSASGIYPAARLELNGEVTSAADIWRDRYPVALGGSLRAKQGSVSFGTVLRSQVRRERLECVNTGDKPLTLGAMKGMTPVWLSLKTEPDVIDPGRVADIVVIIDGKLLPVNEKGRIERTLIMEGLGGRPSGRSLHVFAEVE